MSVTDGQRILDLRRELTEHSFRYYVLNNPVLSDQDYDVLFKELLELERLHPEMGDPNSPTMRVGSVVPTSLNTVKHRTKMLSLDNLDSLERTMQFFDKYKGHEVILEMKVDGLSLHLSYENGKLRQAITRGDGFEGHDVTENARTVRTLPLELRRPVTIEVRGEVYWRLSAFTAYNKTVEESEQYANPRNGASGLMQQLDSREVAKCSLDFVAYAVPTDLPPTIETQEGMLEYLENLGFRTTMSLDATEEMPGRPYMTTVVEPTELLEAIRLLDSYRKKLDLDTDGLVLKISSLPLQRDIGEGERAPHWAAAYKFPPEKKSTKLLGITVQIGKSGQVTPVAQLQPVNVSGVTIQSVSLCNQDELDRLGIDIGDDVWVQRSGEVIPKIVGRAKAAPGKQNINKSYQLPDLCPCCQKPLVRFEQEVHFYCTNPDCYDQVYARLVFAVGKHGLDIDGCGEIGVKTLMDEGGVRRLSDLFAFKKWDIFKPAQRKKIQDGLARARKLPLWRKICALSIEGIGKISAQNLSAKYSSLFDMYADKDGIRKIVGEVATATLRQWVVDNIEEIELLSSLDFDFKQDAASSGPLSGKTFCITGKMISCARDELSALIESKGGIVKGTVTRNVEFLIQGQGGSNNKAAGAAKWGTKTITEEEIYRMMGLPMPLGKRLPTEIEP
jgi:DNA ligase (NAD+)